jgi:hypothetical protein
MNNNLLKMNVKNILDSVKKDNVRKFIGEIKRIVKLDDINNIISKINESDVDEKYKLKYIIIIILGKLIKKNEYIKFNQKYFILREVADYDVLKFKEYLSSQDIINKVLDTIDIEQILYILKEYKNEDNIFLDLLFGRITIDYLKNNKFLLSSVVKYLIKSKEKHIFYFLEIIFSNFDFDFIRKFLENNQYIELTVDQYYIITKKYLMEYFTKEESIILRNILREKVYASFRPIKREEVLEGRTYHEEYQDRYCKKFIQDGDVIQDGLKPLIVTNTEISLPYKRLLKFDKLSLYKIPKQIEQTLTISYKNDNFMGGNKKLYGINEDFNVDMKWYINNIKYMENLSLKDKMTIMGYTHNGDKYSNMYLMQDKDSLTFYLEDNLRDEDNNKFFPLYFQAKEKIIKEKDSILKYFTGDKKLQKKFIEDFINPVVSNIEEIKSYNLILKNRVLLSIYFWFDVIGDFVEDLDRIIRESPPIESPMVVFRGAKTKYYKTSSNLYVNNTFMSTSFNYEVPFKFSEYNCCLKKIILKPGTRALFTDCLSEYSEENEILLGLNNKFKIIEDSVKYYYNIFKYNKKEEYPDNLCIEEENSMDVTVMETVN